mmetsp:Transcript_151995/g.268357  ORF Transcript_151995/g.268357 Transcript_151995/m.268357 type:complete len:112 (+) Transcript_151995:1317-1652(+)
MRRRNRCYQPAAKHVLLASSFELRMSQLPGKQTLRQISKLLVRLRSGAACQTTMQSLTANCAIKKRTQHSFQRERKQALEDNRQTISAAQTMYRDGPNKCAPTSRFEKESA